MPPSQLVEELVWKALTDHDPIDPVGLKRRAAMSKRLWSLHAMLMVVLIAGGVAGWVPLALAGTKGTRPKAPVPQTGQTTCWETDPTTQQSTQIPCEGTGQDGDIQAGVPLPTPRFRDNGDGTVTDLLTGLIWLQQANCFAVARPWLEALDAAQQFAAPQCGLADGSVPGDWRLPNVRELQSLLDFDFVNPTLSNAAGTGHATNGDPFTGVQFQYWSSTTGVNARQSAYIVGTFDGRTFVENKLSYFPVYVWPVRGPD